MSLVQALLSPLGEGSPPWAQGQQLRVPPGTQPADLCECWPVGFHGSSPDLCGRWHTESHGSPTKPSPCSGMQMLLPGLAQLEQFLETL